jgi:hypothetical protein
MDISHLRRMPFHGLCHDIPPDLLRHGRRHHAPSHGGMDDPLAVESQTERLIRHPSELHHPLLGRQLVKIIS